MLGAVVALSGCGAGSSAPPSTSLAPQGPPRIPSLGDEAQVARVTDGDTIRVRLVGADETSVRLIGVDTPERARPNTPVECFAEEAARYLAGLLPVGERVRLVYDVEHTDRYGRTLAYVYRLSDGLFVNLALALAGYAEVLTVPPNVAHAEQFRAAAAEARDARRGLWAAC